MRKTSLSSSSSYSSNPSPITSNNPSRFLNHTITYYCLLMISTLLSGGSTPLLLMHLPSIWPLSLTVQSTNTIVVMAITMSRSSKTRYFDGGPTSTSPPSLLPLSISDSKTSWSYVSWCLKCLTIVKELYKREPNDGSMTDVVANNTHSKE